jgi:hypothetical protein
MILATLFLGLQLACHDNQEIVLTQEEVIDPPKVVVSTTHAVKIIDENGQEAKNYVAKFNQQTRNIENPNLLVFNATKVNKYGEKITITDNQGIATELLLFGNENDINYSVLTIFKNRKKNTMTTIEESAIDIGNDLNLRTVANSYKVGNNNFTGNINFATYFPNLADANHIASFPNLRIGKDLENVRLFLKISRVLHLDILSPSMEQVECKLTLQGRISELINKNQKLWYCDVENAIWKEVNTEITSTGINFAHNKNGYYCIAEGVPGVQVQGRLKINDNPSPNLTMQISSSSQQIYTSNSGHWSTFLPSNSRIGVEVYADCGTISNFEINTTQSEIKNLDINLENVSGNFSPLTGQVKDCNGQLMKQSVLKNTNTNTYYVNNTSAVNTHIATCNKPTVSLIASDISGTEKGNIIEWKIKDNIETGSWFACNRAQNPYLNLIIDGQNKMYWDCTTTLNTDGRFVINIKEPSIASPILQIFVPADGVGDKLENQINIVLKETSFSGNGYEFFCPTSTQGCGFEKFSISHYNDNNDGIIRGSFKGKFWVKTLMPLTVGYKNIEGEFQLPKSF